jgi:hypothetical protein
MRLVLLLSFVFLAASACRPGNGRSVADLKGANGGGNSGDGGDGSNPDQMPQMPDTTPPDPPALISPLASTLTNLDSQALAGLCTGGAATVQVFVNAVLDQSVPCVNGTFSAVVARTSDGTYVITGKAIDAAGNVSDFGATTSWTRDTVAPIVLDVGSPTADGVYTTGATILIDVAFSKVVTVTGVPTLTLETGSTDRLAGYVSGSGSASLRFSYTVMSGDDAPYLDYASVAALLATGATIVDAAGNAAALSLAAPGAPGSLAASKNLAVDTAGPTLELIAPTGGAVVRGGVPTTISWTPSVDEHPAAQPIEVQLSLNSGASWSTIAGPLTDVGSYGWTPAAGTVTTCRVRLIASDAVGNQTIVTGAADFGYCS